METDWGQTILTIASIITISGGLFSWLRNDSKNMRAEFRGEMRQLRTDMQNDMQQLRTVMQNDMQQMRTDMQNDMQLLRADMQRLEERVDTGFKALDDRLRAVETEQSRVVGLLEGLGLSGVLPTRDS